MKDKNLRTLLLLVGAPMLFGAELLFAQNQELLCDTGDAESFVKQSVLLCMNDLPSRRAECMRDAEAQFERCGYRGNFARMSDRVQTRIIVLSLFKNLVTPPAARYRVADLGSR